MTDHATPTPRQRAGTLQSQRGLAALDSGHFSIEERSRRDWLHYLKKLAHWLQWHNVDGQHTDWSAAIPDAADLDGLLALLDGDSDSSLVSDHHRQLAARPDLALLLTFLQLLRHPQQRFAAFTERHLQHYYRQVLHLQEQPASPDYAHLQLLLGDDVEPQVLPAGCRFQAGEDSLGDERYYRLDEAAAVNRGRIQSLISLITSQGQDSERNNTGFVTTTLVDSAQGLDFPDQSVATFGQYPQPVSISPDSPLTPLDAERQQHAPVGLLLSSPLLWLSEGQRRITLHFDPTFSGHPALAEMVSEIGHYLQLSLTTADGLVQIDPDSDSRVSLGGVLENYNGQPRLTLMVDLNELFPPLVLPDDSALHPPGTDSPWLQLEVRQDDAGRRIEYEQLRSLPLAHIDLEVSVSGLHSLLLRNDEGLLDPGGPIQPFGSQPLPGSRLQLAHPELARGPLDELTIELQWMDRPADLQQHYSAYQDYLVAEEGRDTDAPPWPQHWLQTGSGHGQLDAEQVLQPDSSSDSLYSNLPGSLWPGGLRWPARDELPLDDPDPRNWPFWYSLTLSADDFGDSLYPRVISYFSNLYLKQVNDANAADISANAATDQTIARAEAEAARDSANAARYEAQSEGLTAYAAAQAAAHSAETVRLMAEGEKDAEEDEDDSGDEGGEGDGPADGSPDDPASGGDGSDDNSPGDNGPGPASELTPPDPVTELPPISYDSLPLSPAPVPRPTPREVLPPWQALVSQLSVSYSASEQIDVSAAGSGQRNQLLHLHPLGYQAVRDAEQQTLLPALTSAAYLYIGLAETPPGGSLNLLFQHSPVDADPLLADASIRWSYLSANRWLPFVTNSQNGQSERAMIIADDSNGLIDSGIISFGLDPEMTRQGGFPGDNQLWLRAELPRTASRYPLWSKLDGVHSQALKVRFDNSIIPPRHLPAALPAETITTLDEIDSEGNMLDSELVNAIDSVSQPWPGFDGRPPEASEGFSRRASERLRHRDRALTGWDYEHLVLARFPQLIFARSQRLKAEAATGPDDTGLAAGVQLQVVPRTDDPAILKPRVSRSLQLEIIDYLRPRMPDRARLEVTSPQFQEVRFDIIMLARPEYDPGQVLQYINRDLNAWLNPWTGQRDQLNREIYIPDIVAWVRRQRWVDQVISIDGLLARENADGERIWFRVTDDLIRPDSDAQLLVPASRHSLRAPPPGSAHYTGIEMMEIEYDFEIR